MMYGNYNAAGGFSSVHAFGGLLGIVFLIGLVFFVAWAIKTLKKEDLLKWSIFLVAVAAIGWILMTSLVGFQANKSPSSSISRPGMMWGSYDWNSKK